jgi:hypothetical protein
MIHNPLHRIAKLRKACDFYDATEQDRPPDVNYDPVGVGVYFRPLWRGNPYKLPLKTLKADRRWWKKKTFRLIEKDRRKHGNAKEWHSTFGCWGTEERALKNSLRIYRMIAKK